MFAGLGDMSDSDAAVNALFGDSSKKKKEKKEKKEKEGGGFSLFGGKKKSRIPNLRYLYRQLRICRKSRHNSLQCSSLRFNKCLRADLRQMDCR